MANYTEVLDLFNIDRPKCKCCGNDIIYDNTDVTYHNGKINIKGKSYKTVKVVNDITYNLKVCQDCLLKHYPDIKNLSRIFNVMGEPTKFAFDIPDDVYAEKRANYAMTLNKMIDKYGEDEGRKRWDSYCARQAETKSWEYMVETYGIEKAREINKRKSLTLENFIQKYGEDKGNKKWLKYLVNRNNGVSEISQILFNNLDKYIGDKYTTYYHNKNSEYFVWGEDNLYYMDYFIKDLNICIEFNGGCFHGDSRLYADDECCNPFVKNITAKELREKDEARYKWLYEKYGIKTYVIWELDYNPNEFDYISYINNVLKIEL
jgi:hypothetical protein